MYWAAAWGIYSVLEGPNSRPLSPVSSMPRPHRPKSPGWEPIPTRPPNPSIADTWATWYTRHLEIVVRVDRAHEVWMQLGLERDRRVAAEIIHSIDAARSRRAPSRYTAFSSATMTSPPSRRGSTNSSSRSAAGAAGPFLFRRHRRRDRGGSCVVRTTSTHWVPASDSRT